VKRPCTAMTSLCLVLSLLVVCVSMPFASVSSRRPTSLPAREADAEPPLFAFARSLFDSGEYYRAIGEFQRFLFFQAEHPLVSQAQLTIGLAFFCGERWLPASEVFRRVALASPDSPIGQEAVLWMAEARARGGDHPAAIRLYPEAMRRAPDGAIAQRAAYLTGWSQLHQRQWSEARAAFVRVDPQSPYHASAQRLAAALDPPPELPQRSPTVARVFSTVLPGAGQIYTGRTLDGLIGLGLHAALIAGTTGAIWAGLEGAAGIGAFFTWGFYQTQMSNAANSARDFNAQAEDRFIGQLAAQERPLLHAYARPIPCAL
jgi:TolA-binding protein/TM2 domain-containing membrane protein YozV